MAVYKEKTWNLVYLFSICGLDRKTLSKTKTRFFDEKKRLRIGRIILSFKGK